MAIFQNIQVELGVSLEQLLLELDPEMKSYRVLKKSLDARRKSRIVHVYTVETFPTAEIPPFDRENLKSYSSSEHNAPTTVIIGAGPAGLFAALRLVARGMPCQILERGKALGPRMRDISAHWRKGIINPDSNVCFGEGGAGCFSDGKLITRIKSPHKNYVMQELVRFGAPEEILYMANPHVGSNKIRGIINNLIAYLQSNGCPVRFNSRVEDFILENNKIKSVVLADGTTVSGDRFVLATGHSAHDVFEKLFEKGIDTEAKSMAMGFRIEHEQKWLNLAQFGSQWEHPDLPVANYKVTHHNNESNTGVYSFCMCPGGYVLPSSAQSGQMVVNGMSNYNHGSPFANSGIVVSIDKDKWFKEGPQAALKFQSEIERRTQDLVINAGGTREVPVQKARDFIGNRVTPAGKSSCPSGVIAVNLREIYPEEINKALIEALQSFDRKMPGFMSSDALLHGVESRTSSPVRVLRDPEKLCSTNVSNLYPSGEGAGYAGGITSAAVDGIRMAEAIFLT
ncbi:NAD(P)-binding protein [bacterium]|nr:NAD(P)-binding protein [bacterium]